MLDYRKYACELTGELYKEAHKKGVRREKLAAELNISVNQIKNYAYDSSKSATLENFLHTIIEHRCEKTFSAMADTMGLCVYRLPESGVRADRQKAAAEAMEQTSRAFASALAGNDTADDDILRAIEKLLTLRNTIAK